MKPATLGFGLIILLVIAGAFAGCSGTSQPAAAPSGGAGGPASGGAQQSGGGTSAGSLLGIDKILAGTPYNWVEYKSVVNAQGTTMTIYQKHDIKTGKCTMRMESEGIQLSGMEMDCSASGNAQAQTNPNDVKSDVKFTFVGIEPVTVPAGTYATASKYSVTYEGQTMYYWTAPGVPTFVKTQVTTPEGDMVIELSGWG